MNVRCVRQHDAAQIPRGWRGIDVSSKAQPAQMRQRTAVIDVSMGEHDEVDGLWIKGEILVPLNGVLSASLIEPAIEQDALAIDLDQMLRAGGSACGTAKGDFHHGKDAGGSESASSLSTAFLMLGPPSSRASLAR